MLSFAAAGRCCSEAQERKFLGEEEHCCCEAQARKRLSEAERARRDSNSEPLGSKPTALSVELRARRLPLHSKGPLGANSLRKTYGFPQFSFPSGVCGGKIFPPALFTAVPGPPLVLAPHPARWVWDSNLITKPPKRYISATPTKTPKRCSFGVLVTFGALVVCLKCTSPYKEILACFGASFEGRPTSDLGLRTVRLCYPPLCT